MAFEGSTATRRSLLKRGLLLVGAAFGVGAAPEALAAPAHAGPAPITTLTLYGRRWHMHSPESRTPGRLPVRGDRLSMFGELSRKRDGKKAGEFYSAYFSLNSPFGPGPAAAAGLELHTFNLDDGTILGLGSHWGEEGLYAVVGGTGRYAGAKGSYVARQRPHELGGDGTADFVLTLAA